MAEIFLNFILALSIIIAAAKISGYISVRFKQPSVLGELLAGIILGPTILNLLHLPPFSASENLGEEIAIMAEIGVILLMMLAGLELHLPELLRSGKVSSLAGILGVIIPLGLGTGTALFFGTTFQEAIFIGLTLSATSVSISAQTLLELKVLRTRVGLALLGAAVFDDILVILSLSIAFLLVSDSSGGITEIIVTVVGMVAYLGVASLLGFALLPRLIRWLDRLPVSQSIVSFTLVICLLFAWAAEVLGGMAAITGAFLVGLFLARTPYKDRLESGFSTIAYGFFVPVFFVNIGLEVNLRAISGSAWWFAIVLTVVAILSKIGGSGLGGKMGGMNNKEALQLGIGMVSRGEVGLIVASFALSEGLLNSENFSIAVFMVIMATLVTPPMLRVAFSSREVQKAAPDQ